LSFYNNGVKVVVASASNPGGHSAGNQMPDKLIDGSTSTKWYTAPGSKFEVIFQFATCTPITHYKWATANDVSGRDPVRWSVSGSSNGATYSVLNDQTNQDYAVTQSRDTFLPLLPLACVPA
jgi:hypothetical protein